MGSSQLGCWHGVEPFISAMVQLGSALSVAFMREKMPIGVSETSPLGQMAATKGDPDWHCDQDILPLHHSPDLDQYCPQLLFGGRPIHKRMHLM